MKTSIKDFDRFKNEFGQWQRAFGLTDWRVCFSHETTEDESYAMIYSNCNGRVATVIFSDTIDKRTGATIGYDPVDSGRHEALELLLAGIRYLANSRSATESDIDEEIHVIIRRIENFLNDHSKLKGS